MNTAGASEYPAATELLQSSAPVAQQLVNGFTSVNVSIGFQLLNQFEIGQFISLPTDSSVKLSLDFSNDAVWENTLFIFTIGIAATLILVNFIVGLGTRDRAFLYCCLFTLNAALIWGYFFHWPIVMWDAMDPILYWFGILLFSVFLNLLLSHLLKLPEKNSGQFKTLLGLTLLGVVGLPLSLTEPAQVVFWSYFYISLISSYAAYVSFYWHKQGKSFAIYMLLGMVILAIPHACFLFIHLQAPNALSDDKLCHVYGLCSATLAGLMMSLAIAKRYKSLFKSRGQYTKSLKKTLKERTKALEQLRIQLSKKHLNENQVLSSMGHEIRTPLMAILGYAESLKAGDIKPCEQAHATEVIARSSHQLLSIVDSILDVSEIEAGHLQLEASVTKLPQHMELIKHLQAQNAIDKGLEFNINYQFPMPSEVMIDAPRLRQVLLNLTNNAIKFTLKGQIELHVRYTNDALQITVTDTGIGMSEQQCQRMFESRHHDDDLSDTLQFGSSGLYLCKNIVKQMQGEINVESQVGQGSVFTVSLPCSIPRSNEWIKSAKELNQNLDMNENQNQRKLSETGKILVVDDQFDNRIVVQTMLEAIGHEVTATDDGYQAIRLAEQDSFDLILMDIEMPIINGVETMLMMRNNGLSLPILAFTGKTLDSEVSKLMRHGFSDYLAKPVSREELLVKVAEYIKISKKQRAVAINTDISLYQDSFIEGLSQTLAELSHALKVKDWQCLQKHIHSLVGVTGLMGYQEISQLAHKTEKQLKRAYDDSAQQDVEHLLARLKLLVMAEK
ncbi:response regulator [Catenovulum sp. SM1970]|uniref:ATP-binding protein n=1 Tax=Marinifaba aquimaris TaxID=2741323 RepID=UPI001571E122|nr:ATP-binding protein [Marinifaba aquimaris]NTS76768.1 response regulator [Marinifaba aquimaris]